MILIPADAERRIELPGLPSPTRRPVDIDQSTTGFTHLRTLRIYQFDAGSVVDGHAEEDEVYIVVLRGSIGLAVTAVEHADLPSPATLTAPDKPESGVTCAAYLPPHGAYKLTALSEADVAYVRATPSGAQAPSSFETSVRTASDGGCVLLEQMDYAEKLRVRLLLLEISQGETSLETVAGAKANCEALIYVRSEPAEAFTATTIDSTHDVSSWDTVAVRPGEDLRLTAAAGTAALVFVAMATDGRDADR